MQAQYPPHLGYPGMSPQPPQFPSVPSAHLESHGQRKDCPSGQSYTLNKIQKKKDLRIIENIITHWNPNDPKSHVLGGFYYNNAGALTVPFTGRYYVYAQLFFPAKPSPSKNRVLVMAGNRILLMINKDLPGGPVELTGSAGGVFVLSAGEQITVKPTEYNTALWFDQYHCYFGAYLVSV